MNIPEQQIRASHYELKEVWDGASPVHRQRAQKTASYLPAGIQSLLDVGCGDGSFLRELVATIPVTVGVDLCFEPLRRVTTRRAQASATQLPLRSGSFDLVTLTEVLEHMPDNDTAATMREVVRVSRKYVMVTVPFRDNLAEELCLCGSCGRVFHRYGHLRAFDRPDMQQLAGTALVVEAVHTIVPIRKARPLRALYWLQHHVGRRYSWDSAMRCLHCGGAAVKDTGNLVGRLLHILIARIDRRLPKIEDGWLVALFTKRTGAPDA